METWRTLVIPSRFGCVLETFFHLGGFGLYTQLRPHDTIHVCAVHEVLQAPPQRVGLGVLQSDTRFSQCYTRLRQIVEALNAERKAEDVVPFYDYDQQAFLLALDLKPTLQRVYNESCRSYLVFLDSHYRDKVWTQYEQDIMTNSGRKEHIIPVILDDGGTQGAVGIPATGGRLDLCDLWTEVQRTHTVGKDVIKALRNRCVLSIIEKLDAASNAV